MVQAMQFRGSASGKVVRTTAELPDAGPDEVLVKVTDSGLCGSDLHFLRVLLVLGHEGGYSIDVKVFADHSTDIGIVEEFGSACSQFKTEDKRDEALKLENNKFYATKEVSDYASLDVTKPVDRLLIAASAKFNLGLFCPILACNASIIPLSVDYGDLTAPYLPTVVQGNRIVGSYISSRSPKVEQYPMTLEGVTEAVERLQNGKMRYRGVISWNL
ncbi:hypothetical protein AnigIFM59636_006940 [Aspergillus niger]|nr:hypothetical protein AnigIFM59636_006940 [Aspergillus niger]